ncbi:HDOD domain-containing protein [Pseudomonas stutzeri]|uniref:Histidine kinase n=1 Tax=Stutzerimonas stutzeri TaxID=316 RepID=A0A2N8S4D4_STUST|nr:HDOD domain-containing protein [Stutzerimonas stutzeri]MCQ4294145.1 HDOD domain-containing protein [Stutzerimonas stutzeri]PNF81462.1 histidine kinase [Stutzerimonas stutzeri]
MTTTPPLPRTIPAWIKALDDAPLPAFASVHGKVRLALRDSGKSMRQIAELIQTSPVLALRFIQEANRDIGDGQPAESLEVALSRIGLKRAEALLARIPALEAHEIPLPLRQLVLISRHASQQANGLFAARLARLWQDIHWGSLLFLTPAWALVGAYPHLLDCWEQRVLVRGEPASRVERELLGVPLLELCLKLAEHWRLPDWIIQGYRLLSGDRRRLIKALHIARDNEHPLHQQQMLDADPDLRRWLTLPSNTIVLANGLALSSHHSWSGVHSLRWQRLAGLYLQVSLGDLQQMVHQQAAISARECGPTDLWHPAQGLLWPTGTLFQTLREKPLAATDTASEADLAGWREHCRRLLTEPTPFSNVLQLTACATLALTCAGMQRVLVMLVDRKQNRLVAQQCAGLPHDAARLTLAAEQSQIVRRLLEKPAQLRLQPANMAQFSALLPGSLKALFAGEHLLLRSLGVEGRVLMLVIADRNGAPISDAALQTFAKTTQCIEHALGLFGRRGV